MFYIDKNGKRHEVYNCGRKAQEEMEKKGYRLILAEFREDEQKLYNRLCNRYDTIRIVWCGTMIKGIRDIFAFVK